MVFKPLKVTLRLKIFLPFLLLTLVTIALITFLVNRRYTAELRRNLESSLINARAISYTYIRNDIERLIDKAGNVSMDARLQASLATMDRSTLAQTVMELNKDRQADLLAVVSRGGEVVAVKRSGVPGYPLSLNDPVITDAMNGYFSGDVWHVADSLMEIAAVPVMTQGVVQGVLVMGHYMNQVFLDELKLMTGCQLALFVNGQVPYSTHFPGDRDETTAIFASIQDSTEVIGFTVAGGRYLGLSVAIASAAQQPQGQLIIFKSLDEALASLGPIRRNIYLIGLSGILLSLAFSYILARSVTRPVEALAATSRAFGEGRLDNQVTVKSNDEIGTLAEAFEEMRRSLLKAQEELVKTERLSTVGRMANGIIHDFKQPITAVQGYADLLRLPGIDEGKRADYADKIQVGIKRMMEMVNDLLDYARGETTLHLETVNLNDVVIEAVEHLQSNIASQGVDVSFAPGEIDATMLDRRRIRRVLENLLGNAIDALSAGGHINVETAIRDGGIVLTVMDDGPGIPPEIRRTLFDPFVTFGKSKGTGLGLAISKSIIEELDGRIDVTSENQSGTTFYVWLPLK